MNIILLLSVIVYGGVSFFLATLDILNKRGYETTPRKIVLIAMMTLAFAACIPYLVAVFFIGAFLHKQGKQEMALQLLQPFEKIKKWIRS